MESNTEPESKTVAEKIVHVPVEAGTVIVQGTETVIRDGAAVALAAGEVIVETGKFVVAATKTVAVDTVDASRALGHDVGRAVAPATHPVAGTATAEPATGSV